MILHGSSSEDDAPHVTVVLWIKVRAVAYSAESKEYLSARLKSLPPSSTAQYILRHY